MAATLRAVLRHAMTPIVCVGETAEEREDGETEARLTAQTTAALKGLPAEQTAGPGHRLRAHLGHRHRSSPPPARTPRRPAAHIRGVVGELAGDEAAEAVRIQYGGSVRPENTAELVGQPDVDGLLVGGASLEAATFAAIVHERRGGRYGDVLTDRAALVACWVAGPGGSRREEHDRC